VLARICALSPLSAILLKLGELLPEMHTSSRRALPMAPAGRRNRAGSDNARRSPSSWALYLRPRKILVPVVHRLELAAVDDNARFGKKAHLAAERDEARAQLANSRAIVLAEIGDRLGVGDEAAK
jgi:hypothetical protein